MGVPVRGLNCPSCGAAIQLRGFQFSQSVVCNSCLAVLDASDANVAVLQTFDQKLFRYAPQLPLGSRGTWKGDPWEIIGFQVRQITVEGDNYHWQEYLLFNPFRGYRYLSEYEGHWNDIVAVRGLPNVERNRAHPVASWHNEAFKLFQTSHATTVFALGEFPWMVAVGDQLTVRDYVAPPFLLSAEETEDEVSWSLGEYVSGERLRAAFKVKEALKAPSGTFANQPNPRAGRAGAYWKGFGVMLVALIALVVLRFASATDRVATHLEGSFHPGVVTDKAPFVSDTFTLGGRTSNVELETKSSVDGSWLFLGMSLVNDSTGQVLEVGREVSYYYGVDDGESWSEGSRTDHVRVPAVPAGRWFLRMELDGPDSGRAIDWSVSVRRDAPGFVWWLIALVILVLPPIFIGLRSAAFETTRWAESDFAPKGSSSDSDDDSSSDD